MGWLVLSAAGAWGALQIEGRIQLTGYAFSGQPFTNFDFGFQLTQEAQQWQIRVEYGPEWYEVSGCDGTNVYWFLDSPPRQIDNPHHVPLRKLTNMVTGMIDGGVYPIQRTMYTTLPWYVYCLPLCGYERGGTNFPAPWASAIYMIEASLFDEQVEQWLGPPGGFVRSVRWLCAEDYLQRARHPPWLQASSRQQDWRRELEFYRPGYLGAVLEVTQTTRAGGREIPAEFECKRYSPNPSNYLLQRFRGTIQEVRQVEGFAFVPQTTKTIAGADHRLRDMASGVDYVKFQATNGLWPVAITEEKRHALKEKIRTALFPVPSYRRNVFGGRLVVGLMALVFLAPPLYWAWRRRQAKQLKSTRRTSE